MASLGEAGRVRGRFGPPAHPELGQEARDVVLDGLLGQEQLRTDLAQGLALNNPAASDLIWSACWIILGAYLIGRAVEVLFHVLFDFNAYLFTSLDSAFRLIVARRNILLLIMTTGVLVERPETAFSASAWWANISSTIQVIRIIQATWYSKKGKLAPWLA